MYLFYIYLHYIDLLYSLCLSTSTGYMLRLVLSHRLKSQEWPVVVLVLVLQPLFLHHPQDGLQADAELTSLERERERETGQSKHACVRKW